LNLKEEILKYYSKYDTVRIARHIDKDEDLFRELIDMYFDAGQQELAKKAAWILRHCVDQHPYLIRPYIKKIVKYLAWEGHHDAIKRNGLAVLESITLPKNVYGSLTQLCFEFITSGKEPVAIKAYSIGILDKIGDEIPEIRHELKLILQELIPYESAGFKARAKRILAK